MTATTQLADDHPLMVAWKAYKATDEYAGAKRWAADRTSNDGSLWGAFVAGATALSAEVERLTALYKEKTERHAENLATQQRHVDLFTERAEAAEARADKLREALEKVQSRIERSFTDRRGEALSWGGARDLLPIITAALKEATNG